MNSKTKTATVPKTLRGKKRYLVVKLFPSKSPHPAVLSKSLLSFLSELYGSVGVSRQKVKIVEFNPAKKTLIVQCSLEQVSDVSAGLVLWNLIENEPLKTQVVFKSGSLKRSRQKAAFA